MAGYKAVDVDIDGDISPNVGVALTPRGKLLVSNEALMHGGCDQPPAVAYEISELRVPLLADPRRAAELSCHFNMDQHHAVK
ncbi:hypothetical protein JYU34_012706, partial [Plutella xylostella]